jgi:putative ABC transport system permease protein
MNFIEQTWAVTRMYLGDLANRLGRTLVAGLGVAITVGVLVSLLAIGAGIRAMTGSSHAPDLAVVLPANSASDNVGILPLTVPGIVSEAPGVKKDASGAPLVQPISSVLVEARKVEGGTVNIRLRATGGQGRQMNPRLQIVEGRDLRSGTYELIVGRLARDAYQGMGVGDKLMLRGARWTVVGVFSDSGAMSEGGLIGDVDSILSGFDRKAYQMVEVQLDSPAAFPAFKQAVEADSRVPLKAQLKSEYVTSGTAPFLNMVNLLGIFIGGVMALGATAGVLTAMYANVDGRTREMATLRAMGYGRAAILTAIVLESLTIAIPSALLGAAGAWLIFNGSAVTTLGLSFPLVVDAGLTWTGVILAVIIGLIGGFAPAIRALRLPVSQALRAA